MDGIQITTLSVRLLKVNRGTDEISEPQNFVLKIAKISTYYMKG